MSFSEMNLTQFTDILAAKTPTPGGGGASALAGALGIALGSMVGNYTLGKQKYADVEDDIRDLMIEAEVLKDELHRLIDEDARAFEALSAVYASPKDSPDREYELEWCLRKAADAPLRIMRLSCRAIEMLRDFAEKGSVLVVSDAGTGVALCAGAMYAAAINVKVNTKSMTDREYAACINEQVDHMAGLHRIISEQVYKSVMERFE